MTATRRLDWRPRGHSYNIFTTACSFCLECLITSMLFLPTLPSPLPSPFGRTEPQLQHAYTFVFSSLTKNTLRGPWRKTLSPELTQGVRVTDIASWFVDGWCRSIPTSPRQRPPDQVFDFGWLGTSGLIIARPPHVCGFGSTCPL